MTEQRTAQWYIDNLPVLNGGADYCSWAFVVEVNKINELPYPEGAVMSLYYARQKRYTKLDIHAQYGSDAKVLHVLHRNVDYSTGERVVTWEFDNPEDTEAKQVLRDAGVDPDMLADVFGNLDDLL